MSTFLRPSDLATVLSITTRTLGRWRRGGIGPAYIREETGAIFYSAQDVEEWAAACRHSRMQSAA